MMLRTTLLSTKCCEIAAGVTVFFFFSSRRRHTRCSRGWSSDVCSSDLERGMRTAPPLILLLIAANVALFAWELAAGALASRESIVEAGALVRDRVLAGEWWRLESATFLHAGWDHLIGNCLVLYVVGMACEHAFGFARTRSEEHTSELQSRLHLVCRLLLEKKKVGRRQPR